MNIPDWVQLLVVIATIIGVCLSIILAIKKSRDDNDEKFSTLGIAIAEVKNSLSRLIGHYEGSAGIPLGNLFTATRSSPLNLTSEGLRILKSLDAAELVEKYVSKIEADIPNDASTYEIQNICISYATTKMIHVIETKERKKIESIIYEEGGNDGEILVIYAVLFRNKIMEKRQIPFPPLPDQQVLLAK